MKKYKVGILGYFATGKSKAGGQEAKTCSLDATLKDKFGDEQVLNIDTTDWKKHIIYLILGMIRLCIQCENIIMLPAQNSIRVFIPVLQKVNFFFHRKVFYSVVGGWLPEYFNKNKRLASKAKKLDCIFVETKSMKLKLNSIGFCNVEVVPNFKNNTPISSEKLKKTFETPYKICTFSRVMKEKGIEDIISAVTNINNKYGKVVYVLHIYGKIDVDYRKRFNDIIRNVPNYIKYKGMVEPDESVEVIKNYFALIFPTRYSTEGVPGTLIDAYMSGVPVVSSLWKNSQDVFAEGITGYGYKMFDVNELIRVLEKISNNPDVFFEMKRCTLEYAKKFSPIESVEIIIQYFK